MLVQLMPALPHRTSASAVSMTEAGFLPGVLSHGGIVGGVLQFALLFLIVYCIVHVIRRGQDYWWIFLILFFPLLGALVYFALVIWPELSRQRQFRRGGSAYGSGHGKRRIKELEQEVALTDTVENRAELAAAYHDDGQFTLARECYESCLQGLYRDDPNLLFGLAKAYYGEGNFEKTLEILARIGEHEVPEYAKERGLLRAHALAAVGRDEEAIAAFRAIAPKASSLEAWWRLATLLAKNGDDEGADEVCRRMIEDGARMNPVFRRREKEWLDHATQRLKSR